MRLFREGEAPAEPHMQERRNTMIDDSDSDAQSADSNPYAVPQSVNVYAYRTVDARAEEQRRTHLSHEASVQALGTLYAFASIIAIMTALFVIAMSGRFNAGVIETVILLAGVVVFPSIAYGLRRLRPWARIPTILISVVGLPLFPIGTVVSGVVLFLLCSPKGAVVFSERYHEVIRQTPHIRYQTSPFVWSFLAVSLALFVIVVMFLLWP
jgi:hypothetical protein